MFTLEVQGAPMFSLVFMEPLLVFLFGGFKAIYLLGNTLFGRDTPPGCRSAGDPFASMRCAWHKQDKLRDWSCEKSRLIFRLSCKLNCCRSYQAIFADFHMRDSSHWPAIACRVLFSDENHIVHWYTGLAQFPFVSFCERHKILGSPTRPKLFC